MADATGLLSQLLGFALERSSVTKSATGLQGAHIFGRQFVNDEGDWLQRLFPGTPGDDGS